MAGKVDDGTIRVLTWNVHSCIGTDRRFDPERVKDTIHALEPDIAALQEVDSRRDLRDGFDLLGNALGNHRAEVRTIRTPDGDYGHMLLSRWEITAWTHHDISFRRREPRSLIEARIETGAGPISVLATHLGLNRGERRQQAITVAALAEADRLPTVVMGDFNEPTGRGTAGRMLGQVFRSVGRQATFPSRWPLFPLDRIWFEPSLSLIRSDTPRDARRASDHLPLWADFRLTGQAASGRATATVVDSPFEPVKTGE
ncbi:MAG: endonuclease/exonuclease/phosphatase family protein [Woeseia sp.]